MPDLVANAGGVISSYFEWAQNHQRVAWTEADERDRVLARLNTSWHEISSSEPERWRDEALAIGIRKVARAMEISG